MACSSCESANHALPAPQAKGWRRALWIALGVNATMFAIEMAGGIAGGSRSLQADALDFFGDSANYAISLAVAGLALGWRARAAFFKGATLALLGLYVLGSALWAAIGSAVPRPDIMGVVGAAALFANLGVAILLFRFRSGDANMRSVWICSRNDAIGNVAVLLAAAGVFGTGTAWPDLIVAAIMASLSVSGGVSIMRQAAAELRLEHRQTKSAARETLLSRPTS